MVYLHALTSCPLCLYDGSSMTYQVNSSIPTERPLRSNGSCRQQGPDGCRTSRTVGLGAGGRGAAYTLNQIKLPVISPLSRSREDSVLCSDVIVGGTKNLNKDDRSESGNSDPGKDFFGTHFLFDRTRMRLERTRTVIPPLARDYNLHRPTYRHPLRLSKECSSDHSGQPLTLGYERNPNPAFPLPSTLVLKGRRAFSVENCKLSRTNESNPTYNPMTAKSHQKRGLFQQFDIGFKKTGGSYADPLVGASSCYIHRIAELSSLERETVRQQKLKIMRKSRKPQP